MKNNENLLNSYRNIHFIGIGGVSMSGLAETLAAKGFNISGSDNKQSDILKRLEASGIKVTPTHDAKNITEEIDLIVHTAAVKHENPEMIQGKTLGLEIVDRARLMGMLLEEYESPICVSGTHGKTTTTAMISTIFLGAKKDPTINLGGFLPLINSNYKIGSSEYFIAESCEYFDSFLNFYPKIGVILNIEKDHLDYFKDLAHIERSFNKFAKNIDKSGALIVFEGANQMNILDGCKCEIITFGIKSGEWQASNVCFNKEGCASFDVLFKGEKRFEASLSVVGEHNMLNAIAAIAAASYAGIDDATIKRHIAEFSGTKRRFEHKGVVNGITIIDDYAHHPTEIIETLKSAKNIQNNRIIAVFQPHTYTRTKHLKTELTQAFEDADIVILLDIYAAREEDLGEIKSSDIIDGLLKNGKKALYFGSFGEAEAFLKAECINGDLLITMGAGDVHILGETMLLT